jgi:hypothetical protein
VARAGVSFVNTGTSGSALCVDFGEFCFAFKVPLFRIVAESVNKKCNLNLAFKISKSEVSYEDGRGNVFQWSVRFVRM